MVSESQSIVDLIDALDESTILMESPPQAHAMNEPVEETAKGPPL